MDVFCEIPCLTERSKLLMGADLRKKWFKNVDRRYIGESLQKFLAYNQNSLEFLEVLPAIVGTDQLAGLTFRTSRFIGAVPLRGPDTGRQIGDFVVTPRFASRDRFQNYVEILDLLGATIAPDIVDRLPLASGRNFRPPLYLEAVRYVATLEELLKRRWIKFGTLVVNSPQPSGQVDWNGYVNAIAKVERSVIFPTRRNVLNEFHKEFAQLRFVFDICQRELLSSATPEKVRAALRDRLLAIEKKLNMHRALPAEHLFVRSADAPAVRACKEQANVILEHELRVGTAWRVDFNDVFEKFVQHIFRGVARTGGGRLQTNPVFRSYSSQHFGWEVKQIEPDAVCRYKDLTVFIDAKYKSHLYNRNNNGEFLKSEHRHDLHQIMAYSSFAVGPKACILCYPSEQIEEKLTRFTDGVTGTMNFVMLVGIPLKPEVVPGVVRLLNDKLEALALRANGRARP